MQYNQQIYVRKVVLQNSNKKNEIPNSNINISNVLQLPFDVLCYFIKSMMA